MLLGDIDSYKQWNQAAKYYNRYKIVEPYIQDDWRVNKQLTLNLGVRFSFFGTYRERYQQAYNLDYTQFDPANAPMFNSDGSFVQGIGNPLNGVVQCGGSGGAATLPGFGTSPLAEITMMAVCKGHLFNPAPRIGFAWDPRGDGKLAIRGGYGIFYEHTNGNEGNTESLEGSAPLVLTATQTNINGYGAVGGCGCNYSLLPTNRSLGSKRGDLAVHAAMEPECAERAAGSLCIVGGICGEQGYPPDVANEWKSNLAVVRCGQPIQTRRSDYTTPA